MHFGCCVGLSEIINSDISLRLKIAGCDYIELPMNEVTNLEKDKFRDLKSRLKSADIKSDSFNVFIPSNIKITGENVNLQALREHVKKCAESAAELGGKIIVMGSAGARNIEKDFDKTTAKSQIEESLAIISDELTEYNLTVAVEPLCKKESNIINSLQEGAELVYSVGRPNVKLIADYFHMFSEGESVSEIKTYSDIIEHLHFAEPFNRTYPVIDLYIYEDFFDTLKSIKYNKRLSVEGLSKKVTDDMENSLNVFRRYVKYC